MIITHRANNCSIVRLRSNSSHFTFQISRPILQVPHHHVPSKVNKLNVVALKDCCNYLTSICTRQKVKKNSAIYANSDSDCDNNFLVTSKNSEVGTVTEKSFWGAVGLIIGTAVGPGMLGLPAATIRSGPVPSTVAIFLSWIYVISSIILVAELSFAAMKDDNVAEVSFTGLATKTLGGRFGSFVALIYASLSFSLLVACVSGIGSIVSQCFPRINPMVANALFPTVIGIIPWYFSFKAIDVANRSLCILMLFSITALVATGLFIGRANILCSFSYASWGLSSVLPAIPVAVLTMGFHVITPFICKIVGNSVNEARKAILVGGVIPFVMVLSWNLIVLGLAMRNATSSPQDPISLLLSVNSSALPAVQAFAFSALATSLIGYAVSFPKQVVDTLELILAKSSPEHPNRHHSKTAYLEDEFGKAGFITFRNENTVGNAGQVSYSKSKCHPASEDELISGISSLHKIVTAVILGIPVIIASFFPSTFSRALDYSGIYANCFLFGILPPLMTYIYQFQNKIRLTILPGGDFTLLLLFVTAVILAIWH